MGKTKKVELAVIGAGPGGYAAAFRAADLGKKVILIDRDPTLGGVCLNRGCIPSKALLHISKVMEDATGLEKMGVSYNKPEIDLEKIRSHKNKIVSQLNQGIDRMAKARGVETIQGLASFKSNNEIVVKINSSEINIEFEKCIIASGSSSGMITGLDSKHKSILTSRTALELSDIPKKLMVIGGGAIGLELGQVYASLGSEITLVEFMPNLIPGADTDIVKPLHRKLAKQFSSILLSTKVKTVKTNKDDSVKVTIENDSGVSSKNYDKILIAVGRKPNIELLKIDNTDILLNGAGYIDTNIYQQTSVKNIFAIGDVVGNPMLAHKATHEGKVAAEVCCGHPAAMDCQAIPSVVYTDPEVAWAGLTEIEAKENDINYAKGEFPWAASGRAISMGANQGKTKILFDSETKKVLGVGIVGPGAGDMISEAMLSIEMGADAEDIGLTIHPHPTVGETFAMAAEVFQGTITDLYVPKK